MRGRDDDRIGAAVQRVLRVVEFRKQDRLGAEQITERGHGDHCAPLPEMLDRLARNSQDPAWNEG